MEQFLELKLFKEIFTIKNMSIEEKEYKFKITVIGDPAVGKTTLVKKYTTGFNFCVEKVLTTKLFGF